VKFRTEKEKMIRIFRNLTTDTKKRITSVTWMISLF